MEIHYALLISHIHQHITNTSSQTIRLQTIQAESVFKSMALKLTADEIPRSHVVSLSVDNTNSMVGIHNSLVSRCRSHHPEIYVSKCLCHLVHIAASHAHDAFCSIAGVNVEDLLIVVKRCVSWIHGILQPRIFQNSKAWINKMAFIRKIYSACTWEIQWIKVIFS